MINILDNVHRRVHDGSDSSTNRSRDQVVSNLALLAVCLGQQFSNLVDDSEIACVPEDVSPHSTLEAVVQGKNSFVFDGLGHDIKRAAVQRCGGLVLQPDLDYRLLAC